MSKQQRRKGNAKNASSAAAHEYLSQGGATFVGLTPEMNIFELASSNKIHQVAGIDDETRIVIKKLTKKDQLTREKGLKELMAMINTETTSVENCYEHFCGLVAQLTTDGSPSVRLLTMKTIALFLLKLKKAASKGLKKIIPMVLFAKSDVTNSVAAAAAAVIRDTFDADKKQQIIKVFGPSAFELAASIAQGTHELSLPIEYDGSENKEARQSRLETQALNVFLLHLKDFGTESHIWEEYARKLFENSAFVKKVFAGSKETLKVQLLTLCYRFSDPVDLILSLPPVVPYIQNTLDAQTFTPECATAWEGLTLLIRDEKFQSKVSLAKAIYPRFLNVIRKKGNHWRILKNHLLPAVVALLEELKNPQGELKMLTAIMESFSDNLPWLVDASLNAVHCWFSTYADFVRWILTNDRVNLEILETLIPLTCRISEQAMLFNTSEATECISTLINWIIEKKILSEQESQRFCGLLGEQIVQLDKERSKSMRNALTSARLVEFSDLHASLISNQQLADFNVLKNLANSDSEYFSATLNKIQNFSFIEQTEQFDATQSEVVVQLILRILGNQQQKNLKIHVKNDNVGRQLLLSTNTRIWEELLKEVPETVFQEMINFWHEERNGKANAVAVSFLQKMGITLDTKEAAENIDFLISLLHSLDSAASERSSVVRKLFAALFELEEEPKFDHFKMVADNLTKEFGSDHFFDTMFTNHEAFDTERIVDIAQRFDKLIGMCAEGSRTEVARSMMISKSEYENMTEKLHFLELDVLTYSRHVTIVTDLFSEKSESVDQQEAGHRVKIFARKALFNLASHHHNDIHQTFGWQMIQVITSFKERYCLKPVDEELSSLKEEIKLRVKRSDEVAALIIENRAPNFLGEIYGLTKEKERQLLPTTDEEAESLKKKLEILFNECGSPIEYMEKVHEAVQSDSYFTLFMFGGTNPYDWLANFIFAKKFLESGADIFSTENFELKDFALCGMVSVLDNASDQVTDYSHAFEGNPRLEALTTLFMEIYWVLNKAVNIDGSDIPEQSVEEWNDFYAPTLRAYFIRLFRSVRKDQQPTPFIKTLLKVLFTFTEFPSDMPSDSIAREFVPELSVFNYPPFQESCIAQSFGLLTSNVEHIQLIGFAMAKLLMPIMFKTENEKSLKSQDDSEVQVSNRPKVELPVMITKTYPKSENPSPHVGTLLVDLALMPLDKPDASFGQEQRVSYCDSIDGFIKFALNQLLLDQPFEFRHSPISCRIPRSQDRDYYLETDLTASPVFFDKFATRLLFKTITLLPAAVRLFYKGMKNVYMPMFQEAVTKYASKLLIEQELAKVRQTDFGNEMKVRTVPVTGEIIAEYIVDETKMKLTIGLPPDYPLSVPTMTLDKAIVKTDRAKKWLLQLNAYLFHQNGAILEGIEMWKRNVDKGVEGVEDCTICMMTVHQQTHQLPRIKCKQCKNKFHSNCLYKWFESSNQSTCPLCRTNFT